MISHFKEKWWESCHVAAHQTNQPESVVNEIGFPDEPHDPSPS